MCNGQLKIPFIDPFLGLHVVPCTRRLTQDRWVGPIAPPGVHWYLELTTFHGVALIGSMYIGVVVTVSLVELYPEIICRAFL